MQALMSDCWLMREGPGGLSCQKVTHALTGSPNAASHRQTEVWRAQTAKAEKNLDDKHIKLTEKKPMFFFGNSDMDSPITP